MTHKDLAVRHKTLEPEGTALQRLKITLAYDGGNYEGWQEQRCPHRAEPPTIQGTLRRIISNMCGFPCHVHGAGRTDSGVHAAEQVCHVDIPGHTINFDWVRALNRQTPADIKILSVDLVPQSFHAQKDACYKIYSYTICQTPHKALPFYQRFCWHTQPLDITAMRHGANYLVGTHNFASVQNSGTLLKNTVRTLHRIEIIENQAYLLPDLAESLLVIQFTGNGFLKQMVRNLTGLLVWIGQNKLNAEIIPGILATKKRNKLPSPAAPAHGLTLQKVSYLPHTG